MRVGPPWLPRTVGGSTLLASGVAAALHLLMAGSLPLIVTPDGGEYIRNALTLGSPGVPWSALNRTPGYPILLRGIFALLGTGAGGILIAQNVLGIATCGLITWTACRIAGPSLGLAVGLLYAVDPWALGLSNYALTENPTAFAVALAAALVLALRVATVPAASGVALALLAMCFMRPAIQVMTPFFVAAWALGLPVAPRRRAALAAVVAAVFLVVSAPWLAYNASRGVHGFAGGSGTLFWYGAAMADLLDRSYPVDDDTRAAVERYLANGIHDPAVQSVISATNGFSSPDQDRRLGAWARSSVARRPGAYLVSVFHAFLWQLNVGIPGKPPMYDELPYFLDRLTWDPLTPPRGPAPNFLNPGPIPEWWRFSVAWQGGLMNAYMHCCAQAPLHGIPQVPLLLCTVAGVVLTIRRRRWPLALVLAASLVHLVAHAFLLLPMPRHQLPTSVVWYLGLAALLAVVPPRRQTAGAAALSPGD